jgi:acyl-CoA thioester hydrolase
MAVFSIERRVRYFDTDQFHAAHHSRALLWFEEARTELLRALGRPYGEFEEAGIFFPVREATIRYRNLARFDVLLVVAIEKVELGGASLRFEYRVHSPDGPIAEGFTVHACVDRGGKIARLPRDVRELFEKGTAHLAAGSSGA